MPKEPFKEKLLSLISKFDKDKLHYLSKNYLEAQVRKDFIDPFFVREAIRLMADIDYTIRKWPIE